MVTVDQVIDWFQKNWDWLTILLIISIATIFVIRYYTKYDEYEKEPKLRMIWSFILGLVSIIPAILLSLGLLIFVPNYLDSILVAPVAEEISKGIFVLYLARSEKFDGPLDGLIYGSLVGAGFAFGENILYAMTSFYELGIAAAIVTATIRSAFQVIGHPLFTGIIGYGIGAKKVGLGLPFTRFFRLIQSIILHGIWNGISVFFSPSGGFVILIILIIYSIFLMIYVKRLLNKANKLDRQAFERGYYSNKDVTYS